MIRRVFRLRFAALFRAPLLAVIAAGSGAEADSLSVDDRRLHEAARESGDWLTFGRDYSNQRFAPFTAIDRGNVGKLTPAWIYQTGTVGSMQAEPLVVGGMMYVTMPGNDVAAINAATGDEIWRYHHVMRGPVSYELSNRGTAVAYGRVFEATNDARVVALDQATGKTVWDQRILPYDPSALLAKGQTKPEVAFTLRNAPLAYDGKVVVGSLGFQGGSVTDEAIKASLTQGTNVGVDWINAHLGNRAFLTALDAQTGGEVWRWYTTKENGWEGDYAATTPDGMALHRDIKAEKEAAKHYRNAWAAGSNATWLCPAFDPALGLLFVGTGNPAPDNVDLIRPGDNLYANGVAALDGKTGALRWFFQEAPHGQYDATGQPVLIEVTVGGRKTASVLHCGKSGWCYAIDRATGKLLFRTDEFVPHQNTFDVWNSTMSQAPEGVSVAPGGSGGVDFAPVSYDPVAQVVYVAAIHRPTTLTLAKIANAPGGPDLFKMDRKVAPISHAWGTVTALDLKNAGHALWQVKTAAPLTGGTLATAGGVVFTGETDGHFDAFDAATGGKLWSYQTGASVGAPPMSYVVDGRQYVAIATGAAATPPTRVFTAAPNRPGGAVIVFALPGRELR